MDRPTLVSPPDGKYFSPRIWSKRGKEGGVGFEIDLNGTLKQKKGKLTATELSPCQFFSGALEAAIPLLDDPGLAKDYLRHLVHMAKHLGSSSPARRIGALGYDNALRQDFNEGEAESFGFNQIHFADYIQDSYSHAAAALPRATLKQGGASPAPEKGSRQIHKGKDICRNYNKGSCQRGDCSYAHVCTTCREPHPANSSSCTSARSM